MSTYSLPDFEPWLKSHIGETGGFTALIVLVTIGAETVTPVASTYVHIIGDDLPWSEFSALLGRSGQKWDGVAIFSETTGNGGPIADPVARIKLRGIEQKLADDRIHINDGHFFDVWGRRMLVEEMPKQTQ